MAEKLPNFQEDVGYDLDSIRAALVQLREEYNVHNHDGANTVSFNVLRVNTLVAGNSVLAANSLAVRKKSYTDDTAGIWLGLVGGTAKAYFGTATNYFKWTGTGIDMAGSFQSAAGTGQRITITSSDNYLRFYTAANAQVIALGASIDATNRFLDINSPDGTDVQVARFLASDTDGTSIVLSVVNKGFQTGIRITNENTHADRNSNSTPLLDIFQLGTGVGIKIATNSGQESLPMSIAQAFTTSTNPLLKLDQGGITSTNFRKIFTEVNTTNSIWFSNGTTPNGNLSGIAGDICIGADSGKAYYCTGTTNWTAM